jgi:phage terminase large subunit-like protein
VGNWVFDQDKARRPAEWMEAYITYPDGPQGGEYIEVLPYMREITEQAFGWVDKETGRQKYSVIYVEVPRGNAKSTYGSAIALYLLSAFNERAREVYCCAGSRDQATKVFDPAKIMATSDADLASMLKVLEAQKKIQDLENFGFLKATAAEGFKQHGHKTNGCIFDELHVQPNSNLWDAMITSMTKKFNPMMWVFTTAGQNGTFAKEIHDYAVKVRDGLIEDENWLVRIFSAPEDADYFDEDTWKAANPAWDIINKDAFRATALTAQNNPLFLNTFLRYHLNIWTGSTKAFIPLKDWDNCNHGPLDFNDYKGRKCYAGIDYGSKRDLSSFTLLFPPQEGVPRTTVFTWGWCPLDTVNAREKSENVNYPLWVEQGLIMATPGNIQDQRAIREFVAEKLSHVDLQAMGFDKWRMETFIVQLAEDLKVDLTADDSIMRQTPQGYKLTGAIETLYMKVMDGDFSHGGNKVLRWQIDNFSVQESSSGDNRKKPVKRTDKSKIDGVISILLCLYEWLEDEIETPEEVSWMLKPQIDD